MAGDRQGPIPIDPINGADSGDPCDARRSPVAVTEPKWPQADFMAHAETAGAEDTPTDTQLSSPNGQTIPRLLMLRRGRRSICQRLERRLGWSFRTSVGGPMQLSSERLLRDVG